MSNTNEPLQAAYERECAIIGAAYSLICEQKAILKAATARRSALLQQAAKEAQKPAPALAVVDESHNDRK